jgi:protein-disulfide isomerase
MRAIRVAGTALAAALLAGCAGGLSLPNSPTGLSSAGVSPTASDTKRKEAFNPFRDESFTPSRPRLEVIANPTLEQVMAPGPLREMWIGRVDAPVTIIKYASLTCPYCRKFQLETFPVLKREYIDTGKVRFIIREFPIGFQSGAATVALRCAPPSQYFSLYERFLRHQAQWVSQEVRHDPIFRIAKQSGLSRAEFDACYQDEALVANLKQIKDRGRKLGVIGTPNFFVNGKLYKRVLTMKDIHKFVSEAVANRVASDQKQ